MNDVVQALSQQPYQPQSNPYVSLVDIRFASGTDVVAPSNGSFTNTKTLAQSILSDHKPVADTFERGDKSNKNERRSKMTKVLRCEIEKKTCLDAESAVDDSRFQLDSPFAFHVSDFPIKRVSNFASRKT
jgi:hypothetical protein